MSWDNLEAYGNGFRFNGGLDRNTYNPVFAYTLGDNSWLSIEAKNLQHLVDETERKSKETIRNSKKKKNVLKVSVPPNGGIKRWFETMTPENNTLRIYVYTNEKQSDADPDTTLVFYGIKKIGDGKPAKLFGFIPMPATFFDFEYDSMEAHKHKS